MRKHCSTEGGRLPISYHISPALSGSWPRPKMGVGGSQFFPLPHPLPVSVSNEKFLTLQDLCLCPSPGLECPPSLSEGLCIPLHWFRIFHLCEEASRCALA